MVSGGIGEKWAVAATNVVERKRSREVTYFQKLLKSHFLSDDGIPVSARGYGTKGDNLLTVVRFDARIDLGKFLTYGCVHYGRPPPPGPFGRSAARPGQGVIGKEMIRYSSSM